MPINVYDAVERRVVAVGTALVPLVGPGNVGVRNCVVQPNRQLRTHYSYNLIDTNTGASQSAECTALPGAGMMTASFHLN
jgi:hypothetical protein